MAFPKKSKLLRIYIGELDKVHNLPLYEAIVLAAQKEGMAGATVTRGVMSYGSGHRIHTAKLLDLSGNLPMHIDLVDREEKINQFIPIAIALTDEAASGALMTISEIEIVYHK